MKVKVNYNQFFEDWDRIMCESGFYGRYDFSWGTQGTWETIDVTMEELKSLIDKGYGIKINC